MCTHGHNDHINAAADLADAVDAPIVIHPDDRMLWDVVYPDREPDGTITDGEHFTAGGVDLVALHTPGHSPGGVSLHDAAHTRVFSGDTLFKGGPGATGRSFSDRDTIVRSIRTRCSPSRPRPSCTPATVTTPASPTRPPRSTTDPSRPFGRSQTTPHG